MATATGKVVQVLGNVVDVEFTIETLPKINDALRVRVNEDAHPQGNGRHAAARSRFRIQPVFADRRAEISQSR